MLSTQLSRNTKDTTYHRASLRTTRKTDVAAVVVVLSLVAVTTIVSVVAPGHEVAGVVAVQAEAPAGEKVVVMV